MIESVQPMEIQIYLVVYEAVADSHHQEGKAGVGGGEVDHDGLLAGALCLVVVDVEQEVRTEIRTQPATVPGRLCQCKLTNY